MHILFKIKSIQIEKLLLLLQLILSIIRKSLPQMDLYLL